MKWIRFTAENASETKARADSVSTETALASSKRVHGPERTEKSIASLKEGFTELLNVDGFPIRSSLVDSLNHALFLALNASAEPWSPIVALATIAAKYLILLVPVHIALIGAGGTRAMRFMALTAILALCVAVTVNQIIGLVAYTPRPFLIGLGHTLIEHRPSSSFPSNHGTVLFTYMAVLSFFGIWRLAAAFAGLGLLVAWSRIYLGVHFPLDMAGAAVVSAVSAFVALQVMVRCGGTWLYALERWATRLIPSRP